MSARWRQEAGSPQQTAEITVRGFFVLFFFTWQFSQHSPVEHCAPSLSMQVVALQQGLVHSCSDTHTQHNNTR